jgi:RsiW-degrading membrane proteinase PrsW (M82 family)
MTLVFVLVVAGCLLYYWASGDNVRVNFQGEACAATHKAELGDPCYNSLCVGLCFLLSTLAFVLTALNIEAVNLSIEKDSTVFEIVNREAYTIERYPINNVGQRSFEASLGVMLSLTIACYVLLYWRRKGGGGGGGQETPIMMRTSLLVIFVLRGATLSITFALVLEILGDILLAYAGFKSDKETARSAGPVFGAFTTLLSMIVVGCSEEFAKIVAATWGTCFSPAALQRRGGCCPSGCCRLLLVEPVKKKLVLAGLAAGYGFMIIENFSYLMNAASEPPGVYSPLNHTAGKDMKRDEMDSQTISALNWLTTFLRVVCNIHPWLTGYAAARLAKSLELHDVACVGCPVLMLAALPSAVIHTTYDFLLVVHPNPGLWVMAVPFIFWYLSWHLFKASWDSLEDSAPSVAAVEPAAAPTEPATAPQ